jgi:hypothetical protein
MSRPRSRLVMHTNYDGCTFASVQYCSVLGTYEHTDWRHFRKDRIAALQSAGNDGRRYTNTGSKRPRMMSASTRRRVAAAPEGTLGEVVDGTTVQSGVTIAQFLKGFFGRLTCGEDINDELFETNQACRADDEGAAAQREPTQAGVVGSLRSKRRLHGASSLDEDWGAGMRFELLRNLIIVRFHGRFKA